MKDGKCVSTLHSPLSILHSPFSILHSPLSILHSPFSIKLWADAQRIKVAIIKCANNWFSLNVMMITNHVTGMNNGFSSRKDLLLTNPAEKDAGQVRTKATVRFRPKRQATIRNRRNRRARSTSPGHISRAQLRVTRSGSPRPSFLDLVTLLSRTCFLTCIASWFRFRSHRTSRCAHSPRLKKKKS